MIFTAQPDTLHSLWPHAVRYVERLCSETLLASPEDVLLAIQAAEKQLWLISKSGSVVAVTITQVHESSKGRICCIWGACGDMGIQTVKESFAEVEKWARSIGCSTLEVRGRKGWLRVLPGFKETGRLLEKELRRMN